MLSLHPSIGGAVLLVSLVSCVEAFYQPAPSLLTTRLGLLDRGARRDGEGALCLRAVAKKLEEAALPSKPWDRRSALEHLAISQFALLLAATQSQKADASNLNSFDALRDDIKTLVKSDANLGPTLVRLAWHSR